MEEEKRNNGKIDYKKRLIEKIEGRSPKFFDRTLVNNDDTILTTLIDLLDIDQINQLDDYYTELENNYNEKYPQAVNINEDGNLLTDTQLAFTRVFYSDVFEIIKKNKDIKQYLNFDAKKLFTRQCLDPTATSYNRKTFAGIETSVNSKWEQCQKIKQAEENKKILKEGKREKDKINKEEENCDTSFTKLFFLF